MPVKKKKSAPKKAVKKEVEDLSDLSLQSEQSSNQNITDIASSQDNTPKETDPLSAAFSAQTAQPPVSQNATPQPAPAASASQGTTPLTTENTPVSAPIQPVTPPGSELAPLDAAPIPVQPVTGTTPPATGAATPPMSAPVETVTGDIDEGSGSGKKIVFIILGILVVVLSILGGVFYYVSTYGLPNQKKEVVVKKETTQIPTPSPTPAEEELADLSEYKIQVLNGSGTVGEAGKVSDLIKEEGFEDVVAGNAEEYDYKQTEVSLGKTTPMGVYDAIVKAISDSYEVTKAAEFRHTSESYDAIIIVGSKSPEPTEEP